MFDWDDEELTNIIWGEAGESDDHIVPYPDKIEEKSQGLFGDLPKKEANKEISNVSFLEQKKSSIKSEAGYELDSSLSYDTHDSERGFGLNSWRDDPDASLSHAARVDQDSVTAAASNNLTESTNNGLLTEETAQFDKDYKLIQNPSEDREDSDFVDYGWANIGSFDDLDKIFSNNDPIFGDLNVGNTDELWLSTKDVTRGPLGATPLSGDSSDLPLRTPRTSSDGSLTKSPHMLGLSQSLISGFEKLNEGTTHTPQAVQASIYTIEQYEGKYKGLEMSGNIQECSKHIGDVSAATANELPGKLSSCVQGNRQKRLLKRRTTEKKSEVRQLQDVCGTWFSYGSPALQVNPQYPLPVVNSCPPLVLSQKGQLPRPELFQQRHFSGPLLVSSLSGCMVNHYPAPSVLAAAPSAYEVPSGNANSLNKSVNPAIKPPAMSPREKIEKLRRRQKMRAMLAIHRQQQQFDNQVSVGEHPTVEGGKMEVAETLGSFPSIDPNSPTEVDDSSAINIAFDNCSMEELELRRLQDTIANLDTHTRLSIRDSLFRLAQSAMRRQYPSDTSSDNTSSREVVLSNTDVDNDERFTRLPTIETDTNPIDRTVAHLLFHRTLELSGKPAESPASASFPHERKENHLTNVAESIKDTQMTSPRGLNNCGLFSGDTAEIASTNDAAGGDTKMVEPSK